MSVQRFKILKIGGNIVERMIQVRNEDFMVPIRRHISKRTYIYMYVHNVQDVNEEEEGPCPRAKNGYVKNTIRSFLLSSQFLVLIFEKLSIVLFLNLSF